MSTNVLPAAQGTVNIQHPRTAGMLELLESNASLLVAVAAVAAYCPPLMRSLWVDEAGTYWMACRGPLAAIQRTSLWPGQSILYAVITSFFCFHGSPVRDLLLRVPALLGAAAACYFLYRFAEDAFGAGAGRIAAVIFAFSPSTVELATQARPYSLAMAAAAASCWTLYRWATSRGRSWLVGYVISSTLVIYLHYLFCVIFAVHAVFLVYELILKRRLSRIRELLTGYLVVALLVIPLFPHLLLLVHQAQTLPFTAKPSGLALAGILVPPALLVCGLGAGLLAYFFCSQMSDTITRPSPAVTAMLLVWWAAGPMLLFAVTSSTTMQVFAERYVSYSGLALALILTCAGCLMVGARTTLSWALLLTALMTAGNLLTLAGPHQPDVQELGPFMRVIHDESVNSGPDLPPVFFQSALVESNFYDWRSGNPSNSYLYAPFAAYPIKNKLLPLPARLTPEVEDYVVHLLETDLKSSTKIIFVPHDVAWIYWFTGRFEQAGFTYRWKRLNAYWVIVFERRTGRGRH